MSDHVLLNIFNQFRKRDKMQGLPCILSSFRNEFNNSNNTDASLFDSIYHMALKFILKNRIFGVKRSIFCHIFAQCYNELRNH